jgi:hypothetical protein
LRKKFTALWVLPHPLTPSPKVRGGIKIKKMLSEYLVMKNINCQVHFAKKIYSPVRYRVMSFFDGYRIFKGQNLPRLSGTPSVRGTKIQETNFSDPDP